MGKMEQRQLRHEASFSAGYHTGSSMETLGARVCCGPISQAGDYGTDLTLQHHGGSCFKENQLPCMLFVLSTQV